MITPEIATKFYRAWVESGFQGWAEFTLVAEVDRRIAGFGIWKKRSEREGELGVIHYSLAGINPDFAGRGLYSSLAAEGMQMAVTRGPHHLLGAVHVSNFAVHRALQKLGWKIRGARHSFHKWLQS
jgi:RimJ/RimL family protein N-acetyltransferase